MKARDKNDYQTRWTLVLCKGQSYMSFLPQLMKPHLPSPAYTTHLCPSCAVTPYLVLRKGVSYILFLPYLYVAPLTLTCLIYSPGFFLIRCYSKKLSVISSFLNDAPPLKLTTCLLCSPAFILIRCYRKGKLTVISTFFPMTQRNSNSLLGSDSHVFVLSSCLSFLPLLMTDHLCTPVFLLPGFKGRTSYSLICTCLDCRML